VQDDDARLDVFMSDRPALIGRQATDLRLGRDLRSCLGQFVEFAPRMRLACCQLDFTGLSQLLKLGIAGHLQYAALTSDTNGYDCVEKSVLQ